MHDLKLIKEILYTANYLNMKTKTAKNVSLIAIASIGVMACNPLNKMSKKAEEVNYTVTPNPIEMHGDSVEITVKGSYPAKYFHKKAVVDIKPTFYADGNGVLDFETITLVGQDAEGEGRKVNYDKGGSFTYVTKVPYTDDIQFGEVKAKVIGKFKSKEKELTEVKVADGTIITPNLVHPDDKPILGSDEFSRITTDVHKAEIHYLINSAYVRPAELRDSDVSEMFGAVKEKSKDEKYSFKKLTVSAYASPDGEISFNESLADDRAKSAGDAVKRQLNRNRVKIENEADFYNLVGKGEDWDGFKAAMQASDIEDKNLIIRVLEMYDDKQKREEEIKNLAETYEVLKDKILPGLRRSQLALSIDKVGKTDEQISELAANNPSELNVEELLYAATLTDDMNAKFDIYQSVVKVFPDDWRGYNNSGYIKLMQNDLTAAKNHFNQAEAKAQGNPVIMNNLGVIARLEGDRAKAAEYYSKASGAGDEVNYNMGILNILDGDYSSATSNLSGFKTLNTALAQILNGQSEQALKTIDASDDKTAAKAYYLKAISGARSNNKELMMNNLKTAVSKDPALKDRAKKDAEFLNFDLSTL